MTTPAPFIREAGAGPGVLCLQANASSSSQWRGLTDRLAPRFHVLAADGYGAGKSPPWPADRVLSLQDEVALLDPAFTAAGDGVLLVGHSYGAALALKAALAQMQTLNFDGLGHMGPVTHPDTVDAAVVRFLDTCR
jgi:pimeloyl-ACP methyl ester carboxylesterase